MRVNHSRKNQDPETEIEAKHNDCKTRVLKFISSNVVLFHPICGLVKVWKINVCWRPSTNNIQMGVPTNIKQTSMPC